MSKQPVPNESDNKPPKARANGQKYLKYSGMVVQIGGAVLIGAILGKWLDGHFELAKPYFTLLFTVLFLMASFYLIIKDLIKDDN